MLELFDSMALNVGAELASGQVLTPIVIVCGAILTMIAVRNWQLADRSRANVTEALYTFGSLKTNPPAYAARYRSLSHQNHRFGWRYRLTFGAFAFVFAGLLLFGLNAHMRGDSELMKFRMAGIALLAGAMVTVGAMLMLVELSHGSTTLELNESGIFPPRPGFLARVMKWWRR